MIDLLLVSNDMEDIMRIKLLFMNQNYNVKVTTNNHSAHDLILKDPPHVCVYYAKYLDKKIYEFYRLMRHDKYNITVPMVILVEPELQQTFAEYFKFTKSVICSSTITKENFDDLIKDVTSVHSSMLTK